MKLGCALGASFLLVLAAPAAAQVYPGEEVTVNPAAIGHGYLLYPGGKYGRHVGNLLQPGDRGGPIHLHMPSRHPASHVARHVKPAAEAPIDLAAGDTPPPPPHPARHTPPRQVAAAPPPAADINAVPEDSAARLFAPTTAATPAPSKPSPPPAKPRHVAATPPAPTGDAAIPFTLGGPSIPPPPKPQRSASATPPPANTTTPAGVAAGLRKQSVIPFAAGASSPATADVNAIHGLATTLNAALAAGAARVQLEAYGGPRGDKSSDSRRLSLKRALVIRELLIEDGVPSERIDVRAMGGVDDSGAADRVDVYVRA